MCGVCAVEKGRRHWILDKTFIHYALPNNVEQAVNFPFFHCIHLTVPECIRNELVIKDGINQNRSHVNRLSSLSLKRGYNTMQTNIAPTTIEKSNNIFFGSFWIIYICVKFRLTISIFWIEFKIDFVINVVVISRYDMRYLLTRLKLLTVGNKRFEQL